MLSKELEMTLNEAFRHARGHRHEFMTVEHLLLALLDNEAAVEVLRACAADLDELRDALCQFIEDFSGYCSGQCSVCSLPARRK